MHDGSGKIKRPLLLMGAAFFVTLRILTSYGVSLFLTILPIAVSAVGFSLVFVHKKRAAALTVIFLTVAAACVCFLRCENSFSSVRGSLTGDGRVVVGQIYEMQEKDNGSECVVKAKSVDGIKTDCKMNVRFHHIISQRLETFTDISFVSDVYGFEGEKNEDVNYYKSEGIYLLGSCNEDAVTVLNDSGKSLRYYLNSIRSQIFKTVTDFIPNENGKLILAFSLGEKSLLSKNTVDRFRICGLSHIMAISGLHVYTWSNALFVCLIRVISKRKAALFSIALTYLFVAFTGFSPSAVRAGIMVTFVYVGYVFLKVPDSLNSLGAASLMMCVANPYIVHNVSFLLSFSAALGLSITGKSISRIEIKIPHFKKLSGALSFLARSAMICVVATVFTLPVSVFTFGKVSLLSILSNVLCVELSMLVMIVGFIGAILASVGFLSYLGYPMLILAGVLSKMILKIVSFLSRFDFLYIYVGSLQVKVCVNILVMTAVMIFMFRPQTYKNKLIVALTAVNTVIVCLIVLSVISFIKG